MARGNPNPSKKGQFKKGQSGNPGGMPKLPEDIKEARKLNQIELERIINKYLHMSREEVQNVLKSSDVPMMEAMVASIVSKAASGGDHLRLDFILNRIIGKVKDKIEVAAVKPYVINNLDGTKTVLGVTDGQEKEGLDWKDP